MRISLVRNGFLWAATQTPKAHELPAGPEHLNVQLCFNFLKPQDTSPSSSSVWSEIFWADNDAKLCFPWFPSACYATGTSHHPQDAAPLLAQGYEHLHRHQFSTLSFLNTKSVPNTTGLQNHSLVPPNFVFFFLISPHHLTMMNLFEPCYCSSYNYYYYYY